MPTRSADRRTTRRVLRCQPWLKRCGRPSPPVRSRGRGRGAVCTDRGAAGNHSSRNISGEAHTGRDTPQERQNGPRTGVGSRPRTCASLERRRRWAASGRLPPALAAKFSLAEHAVLALIAAETARRGDCRLSVPHLAALVGVAETTVRNAIREARKLGLLTVEERKVTGFRNLPNVVRIVSPEWTAWLRLARKGAPSRDPLPEGVGANPRTARLLRF